MKFESKVVRLNPLNSLLIRRCGSSVNGHLRAHINNKQPSYKSRFHFLISQCDDLLCILSLCNSYLHI